MRWASLFLFLPRASKQGMPGMPQQNDNLIGGPVVAFDDPRSRTRLEFCGIEHISLSSYHALQKNGLGPEEISPPGTKINRITAQAHAGWRARMRELAQTEAAKLEAQRRSVSAKIAGEIAAQSPLHISEINRQRKRRRAAEAASLGVMDCGATAKAART
jgi:hypothetical protein